MWHYTHISLQNEVGGNVPKEPKAGHGIERNERNEDQPTDKHRAQDPSSTPQDKEQGNGTDGQSKKPDDSAN
jgi:hypothetical protein